jgi:hypothetical protein
MANPISSSVARARVASSLSQAIVVSSGVSARGVAAIPPVGDALARTHVAGVNGRKVVDAQAASIAYLSDNVKLQLPGGLFGVGDGSSTPGYVHAKKAYESIRFAAGVSGIPAASRVSFVVAGTVQDGAEYAGPITEWSSPALANRRSATVGFKVVVSMHKGALEDDGSVTARGANLATCDLIVHIAWGVTEDLELFLVSPLLKDESGPDNLEQAMEVEAIQDQLGDFISGSFSLNFGILDFGFLKNDVNRWKDNTDLSAIDENRFIPKLGSYTTSMIAALNLKAVGEIGLFAWTRAYAASMGLLPIASSLHNQEYQITFFQPEATELDAVLACHPAGSEGRTMVNFAWSHVAAFGACHLANDHTFKANDPELKRRSFAYYKALRTVMTASQVDTLLIEANVQVAMRTTVHPFGLSASWGAFVVGKKSKTIAEPLQIRGSVVPPTVAKVGLVVSQVNKMLSLPIGGLMRATYGPKIDQMVALRNEVVDNAAQYSNLFKHYGYTSMRTLTVDQEGQVASLMPIVAGYASVFETDKEGKPVGALLAQSIQRTIQTEGGSVTMYAIAFENYMDSAADLRALVVTDTVESTSTVPATVPAARRIARN